MKKKSPEWPSTKSKLLKDVVKAFVSKLKGISNHLRQWEASSEVEDGEERLNIDFTFSDNTDMRLVIWQDGVIWLRICRGNKQGWLFNYDFYGDIGDNDPNSVVKTVKNTFTYREDEKEVRKIWSHYKPYDE